MASRTRSTGNLRGPAPFTCRRSQHVHRKNDRTIVSSAFKSKQSALQTPQTTDAVGSLCLGVDVGTKSTKALIYDVRTREVIGRGVQEYDLISSEFPSRAEQHPSTWEMGMKAAIGQAMTGLEPESVGAMAVSGQQHGLVVVDEAGQVLRPAKLWCDTESAPQAQELSAVFGWNMQPAFTASKILWMKQNEPEIFNKVAKVMLPHDYLNFRLTGAHATERGDASGTALFDSLANTFRPDLCSRIHPQLHSMLPAVLPPDACLGNLTKEAAETYGLSPNTVVAAGSGDNMMSALGAGAVSDGVLVMSLGTSGTLFGCCSKPIKDLEGVVAPFCDATGNWLPLVCTQNCTNVPEDVCASFGIDRDAATLLAAEEPAGCDGVNYLPYLSGARTPNWPHASGTLLGLKAGCMRPGLLYRAALEGVTFSLFGGYLVMQQLGVQVDELRVVGGGSKNRLWRQIIADIFQVPLRFPKETESAALGAALQAAAVLAGVPLAEYIQQEMPRMADDVVTPNEKNAKIYADAYQRHADLGRTLFG
mmetsp:Transcript_21338/g.40624  ORF Transcript_21338/g.40624 Transcript_21338/m.40624 type:complete len:534 (-) Transcript_21338:2260-3861(-)